MKFNPYIILSASKDSLPANVNAQRTDLLRRQLEAKGWEAIPVQGSYNGSQEASFMVPAAEGSLEADTLGQLAWNWNQDSVLYIDPDKRATLMFSDGKRQPLGPLKEIDPNTDAPAFTQLPNGRRFAA